MKYAICAAPMLLCSEIVSIVCITALLVCFLLDLKDAKEGKR